MLLGDDDPANARWGYRNRVLAQALTLYEAGLCKGCGQPLHEATDEDGPQYSAEDYLCRGCAVMHGAGSEHDKPGTRWYLDVKRRSE